MRSTVRRESLAAAGAVRWAVARPPSVALSTKVKIKRRMIAGTGVGDSLGYPALGPAATIAAADRGAPAAASRARRTSSAAPASTDSEWRRATGLLQPETHPSRRGR